ncbi:MAG TPA: c-type cytochrome [Novosphingobium sp.]|nr:c-type cytochrome [Novosphingobium sp.]HZV09676.1 c-type cytochrome [Novosphingobium sp.]
MPHVSQPAQSLTAVHRFTRGLRLPGLALALAAAGFAAPALAGEPPAVFARCAVCHNAAPGAPDKVGPNLWGVYGRKAASTKYNYSAALKGAKLRWDEATLDKWISGPMTMVPGTMMSFPGIKDAAKRAEIIAFLKQAH